MRYRLRIVVTAAALLAAGLTGCSLFGLDPGEPLVCDDDRGPSSVPGEAAPVLVIAEGSAWDRTLVVYADGNVATLHEADPAVLDAAAAVAVTPPRLAGGPYTGAVGSWQRGYLQGCALERLHTLAQDALWDSPQVGAPNVTDQVTTLFHYDDGGSVAELAVYAHDSGFTSGLSWSERRARDRVTALTDFLAVNVVATADLLPLATLQVDGTVDDLAADFTWPAPHPRDVVGDTGCGVLEGDVARAVYAHLLEVDPTAAGLPWGLHVRALPPGVAACSGA